jgi:hypothetical protein
MTGVEWAGVAAMVVVAIITGRYARAGHRTQAKVNLQVARLHARKDSADLALEVAEKSSRRLDVLEDWEGRVLDWWNYDHSPRDDRRDTILERVALGELPTPAEVAELGPNTPMPRPIRRTPTTT